jgi:hypothetical protein
VNTDHGRQQSADPEEDRRSFAGFHAFVGRNPVPLISCDKMSFHPFGTCAAWSRESPVEQGSHSAETFPIPLKRSLLRINREAVVASLDGEISSRVSGRVTRHAPRRGRTPQRFRKRARSRDQLNWFGSLIVSIEVAPEILPVRNSLTKTIASLCCVFHASMVGTFARATVLPCTLT